MSSNRLISIDRVESSPTEPITLAEAKTRLIITSTDDDTLITSLLTSGRKMVENSCNISLVPKTITMFADLCKEWELPYGPITGVNLAQTRSGTQGSGPATYETATTGWGTDGGDFLTFNPQVNAFGTSNVWGPDHYSDMGYPINRRWKIIYTAGYTIVPQDLKEAILAQIVHDYENRGEINLKDTNRGLCAEAESKAAPYRRELWF